MYLIVIAWIYVVLMMSVAEATASTGTLLGALITFVLYGLAPVALVVYLMSAPARNKAIKKRHAQELADQHAESARADTTSPAPGESLAQHQPDAQRESSPGAEALNNVEVSPVKKS